jgi:hypothetical protein
LFVVPVVALGLGALVAALAVRWLRAEVSATAAERVALASLAEESGALSADAHRLAMRFAAVRAAARSRQGDG